MKKARFLTVAGILDTALKNRVVNAAKAAIRDGAERLVFDLQTSASSDLGPCQDLAEEIGRLGGGDRKTVAFIGKTPDGRPVTLSGHGMLIALACDEIIMNEEARIGNAYAGNPDEADSQRVETAYDQLARERGRDTWLVRSMVSKQLRIWQVSSKLGVRFLPDGKEFEEFQRSAVGQGKPKVFKESGERKLFTGRQAKECGLVKYPFADELRDAARLLGVSEAAAVADMPLDEQVRAVILRVDRYIDEKLYMYVLRQLKQIEEKRFNLVIVEIDSTTGQDAAAENIAKKLADLQIKTVAWVPKQAVGPATLIAFGCKELVMGPKAVLGDFRAADKNVDQLADSMAALAEKSKYPPALVRRFVDPSVIVYEVRKKGHPNRVAYRTNKDLEQPEVAAEWEKRRAVAGTDNGALLKVTGDQALQWDLAVSHAADVEEIAKLYGVNETPIVLRPGWVDTLLDALTSSGGTVFLLSAGLLCLYLELQFPGFGVPGIMSAICFVLFFWSRVLSDTAGSLEIVMFLLGLVLLGIELFVIPGFGVTGIAGLILILSSLVLASQSFAIPQSEAETRRLVSGIVTVGMAFVIFLVAAISLARFFPRLPMFARFVLTPTADADDAEAGTAGVLPDGELAELLGQIGVATSPLRPAGRMQLGDQFLDVLAQGDFIEPGQHVEIIEVHPNRIIVKATA